MRLKTSIKKISAIGLSLAMTIGMVPIWSTQALAETAQKLMRLFLNQQWYMIMFIVLSEINL